MMQACDVFSVDVRPFGTHFHQMFWVQNEKWGFRATNEAIALVEHSSHAQEIILINQLFNHIQYRHCWCSKTRIYSLSQMDVIMYNGGLYLVLVGKDLMGCKVQNSFHLSVLIKALDPSFVYTASLEWNLGPALMWGSVCTTLSASK